MRENVHTYSYIRRNVFIKSTIAVLKSKRTQSRVAPNKDNIIEYSVLTSETYVSTSFLGKPFRLTDEPSKTGTRRGRIIKSSACTSCRRSRLQRVPNDCGSRQRSAESFRRGPRSFDLLPNENVDTSRKR